MKFHFNYAEYRAAESSLSKVEEKVIRDQFETVVAGNCSFEDMSQSEIDEAHWLFRHGWICRSMCC